MTAMGDERKRGRPPTGGRGVPIRVPHALARQARIVAAISEVTMGELITAMLAEPLAAAYRDAMNGGTTPDAPPAARAPVEAADGTSSPEPATPAKAAPGGRPPLRTPEVREWIRRQVLELAGQGLTQTAIADQLRIGRKRVRGILRARYELPQENDASSCRVTVCGPRAATDTGITSPVTAMASDEVHNTL
ncbi:MAG: hypothetical protein JO252_12635 [Planctomycetaceae bacterium]|nr:hypothetical protein [Planctomycetaceae bacterium]